MVGAWTVVTQDNISSIVTNLAEPVVVTLQKKHTLRLYICFIQWRFCYRVCYFNGEAEHFNKGLGKLFFDGKINCLLGQRDSKDERMQAIFC